MKIQKKWSFTPFSKNLTKLLFIGTLLLGFLSNCSALKPQKTDNVPTNALERARKNVNEGKGVSIGNLLGDRKTNYEFSTSNPLWRASLEVVDFLPLSVVDYSGGIIITDWYNNDNSTQSLKITIRFLSNEIRADSLQIIVHQKNCSLNNTCKVNLMKSKIKDELISSIIKKAALLEKENKK